MGRSGHVNRFEPEGMYFELSQIGGSFQKCRLGASLSMFQWHNLSWFHDFIFSFKGNIARIMTLQFPIIEESILEAMRFPTEGERWFKK